MIVLLLLGIIAFCWLTFTLAVYAIPAIVGLQVFFWVCKDAGFIGGLFVGVIAGALTLAACRYAFAFASSPILRLGVALLFTVPAAITGYFATRELASLAVPSHAWQVAFAIVGALAVGWSSWIRLAAEPVPPPT